jgi:hypothetical protein
MTSELTPYCLFPYTVLSQSDYRHFSILLPQWVALKVTRAPLVPEMPSARIAAWPVIDQPEQLERIQVLLRGYQEFAAVHGENSLLAALSHETIARDFSESRFRIETHLKGHAPEPLDEAQKALLEAAIFTEMARDLDTREIELASSLTQVDVLEEKFREILGIADGDDAQDAAEDLTPHLIADRSHLSFMLRKRLWAWFRLWSARSPQQIPLLVTMNREVLEELFEPFESSSRPRNQSLHVDRTPLASIPALDGLPVEEFLRLQSDPELADLLGIYWSCLDEYVASSTPEAFLPGLDQAAQSVGDYLRNALYDEALPGAREVRMEHWSCSELSLGSIREYFDKAGYEGLDRAALSSGGIRALLILS